MALYIQFSYVLFTLQNCWMLHRVLVNTKVSLWLKVIAAH